MHRQETKAKKGFNHAMIGLILFALAFAITFFNAAVNSEFLKLMTAMLYIVGMLIGVLGFFCSVKGLREPHSMHQIVGITVNGIFVVMLIWVIGEVISFLN